MTYVSKHAATYLAIEEEHPYILSSSEIATGIQWFGFNPNFGWKRFSEMAISSISKQHLDDARHAPGIHVNIAGGQRNVVKELETWRYGELNSILPKIEHCFRSDSDTQGCCVWLTSCMLVNTVN